MTAGRGAAARSLPTKAPAHATGRPRSEACRQRILAAARDLLEEQGFRAVTMEAIAERAETSKVTVYRWWSHKAAVFLEAMLAEVSPVVAYRESLPPLLALRDQMTGFTRFLRSKKARLLMAVLAEGVLDDEVGQAFRAHWVRPRRDDVRKLLASAVAAGDLRPDVDSEAVIDMLFGPLYCRALINHLPMDRDFGGRIFDATMKGLVTDEARVRLRA